MRSYKVETDTPVSMLRNNNLDGAIASFDKSSDLISYLERGSVYRMQDYRDGYINSNSNFNNANNYVNKWLASYHNGTWGGISDTFEAGLVNDKVLDYQIKDYEKVMLSTYVALNYISLGNWDNARVEIKRMYQIEDRIRQYREVEYQTAKQKSGALPKNAPTLEQIERQNSGAYSFDFINRPSALGLQNSYQSAFSHYLAGFIFESLGEYDLARLGYVRALQLNPSNALIKESINNVDNKSATSSASNNNKFTDVLFIEEVGHAPQLKSITIPIPWVQSSNGNNCFMAVTMSLPMLDPDKLDTTSSAFLIDNNEYNPLLFTDVNLMAARSLHDNLPNIFIRNMLRVARDYTLQQAACNNGVGVIGIASLLGGSVINSADERTWVMLPSKVYAQRVKLNRGVHKLQVLVNGSRLVSAKINLTAPYQVITWRVVGNSVYFSQ
jgi:hypothetical protein